jgi:hypothetical protein
MAYGNLAKTYAAVIGIVLVVVGLIGFIGNPIVGPTGIFATNAVHNIVHLLTGAIALYIAFGGLAPAQQATWLIGLGVLYLVIGVLVVVSPTLFGLFGDAPANAADHVLHFALGIVSLVIGYMARGQAETSSLR